MIVTTSIHDSGVDESQYVTRVRSLYGGIHYWLAVDARVENEAYAEASRFCGVVGAAMLYVPVPYRFLLDSGFLFPSEITGVA